MIKGKKVSINAIYLIQLLMTVYSENVVEDIRGLLLLKFLIYLGICRATLYPSQTSSIFKKLKCLGSMLFTFTAVFLSIIISS